MNVATELFILKNLAQIIFRFLLFMVFFMEFSFIIIVYVRCIYASY